MSDWHTYNVNTWEAKRFVAFLKKHKMSQKAFASFSKTPMSTINDFYTGKTRVPGWVDVMMNCYETSLLKNASINSYRN